MIASNGNNTILLFSNFELPESCANSKRVFLFAKMLKCSGYQVELLGVTYREDKQLIAGEYDGFPYRMICAPAFHGIKTIIRTKLLEKQLKKVLEEYEGSLCAIIISNVYFDFSRTLISYSKNNNVPLLVNSVEWYDKNNDLFCGLTGKMRYIQNRYALMHIHKKMHNIIAISSYLSRYYKSRGCNTCVIPTLVDMDEYADLARDDGDVIRIAYAGSPAKKDYVCNAVHALCYLSEEERSRLVLHFYGASENDFLAQGVSSREIDLIRDSVVFHGKIPYSKVKKCVSQADYTLLLRPDARYANAGFPTKVGESMACGTPVIANLTSDLAQYVISGKTGIVCANETPEACAKALRVALDVPKATRKYMSDNSLTTARDYFDYRNYCGTIVQFIDNAKSV